MNAKVEVKLRFHNARIARTVHDSINPDNIDFPDGLEFIMSLRGSNIEFSLNSALRVETLAATVDEILTGFQISVNSLEEVM